MDFDDHSRSQIDDDDLGDEELRAWRRRSFFERCPTFKSRRSYIPQSSSSPYSTQALKHKEPSEALTHPPTKRRPTRRTEEERIDYLRADPYVAEFEAYRVRCASCDKWVHLRPNLTYCSFPWDAHRKSCLSKKMYVFLFDSVRR